MIKFEVMGIDKDDLKAKVDANFEADADNLEEWKKVSASVQALIDALGDPKPGFVISARVRLCCAEGMIDIDVNTFPSTVFGGGPYY